MHQGLTLPDQLNTPFCPSGAQSGDHKLRAETPPESLLIEEMKSSSGRCRLDVAGWRVGGLEGATQVDSPRGDE